MKSIRRTKIGHPQYKPSDAFLSFLAVSILGFLGSFVAGFFSHLLWLGCFSALPIVWVLLVSGLHEAAGLTGEKQIAVYDQYHKLPERARNQLPKLTVARIAEMTSDQLKEISAHLDKMRIAEQQRVLAERALDPFSVDLIRALKEQVRATKEETKLLTEIKKELE